jgi:RHS repeat-associated protein
MTVPMGFSGTNNAKKYEYIYDSTGRQVGMDIIPSTVTSNATLSANVGSNSQTRFYYNDSENRIKLINKAGDVYYFVYDPTASVPAVVYEAVNNGEAVTTYLNMRELDGSLISRDKYDGTSLVQGRTYHFDGLGSTMSLTDEDGDVTDTYTYDAWGNVTNHTGSTNDNPYQYVGKLGYYTHYQEPTYVPLQLGVRYYDPTIGRFTQIDPMKDGINWYPYTSCNPVVNVDPSGLADRKILPTKIYIDSSCNDKHKAKLTKWVYYVPESGKVRLVPLNPKQNPSEPIDAIYYYMLTGLDKNRVPQYDWSTYKVPNACKVTIKCKNCDKPYWYSVSIDCGVIGDFAGGVQEIRPGHDGWPKTPPNPPANRKPISIPK